MPTIRTCLTALALSAVLVLPTITALSRNVNPTGDATIRSAAEALYGTDIIVYPATDEKFTTAFPGIQVYWVEEKKLQPHKVHAMAWNSSASKKYDFTKDFDALFSDLGVTVSNATTAVKYAEAYTQVANTELQAQREVVYASDSNRVNFSVADPIAESVGNLWQVRLTTWSYQNGVIANWTVKLDTTQLSEATWEVVALARGNYSLDLEATAFRIGTIIKNTYNATGVHALKGYQRSGDELTIWDLLILIDPTQQQYSPIPGTAESNFDGSQWQPKFTTGVLPPPNVIDLAHALAAAGVNAYNKQVTKNAATPSCTSGALNPSANWTFESKDPDCELEINIYPTLTLLCGACILAGYDVKIYIPAFFKEWANSLGAYLNPDKHNLSTIARTVIGHEHFHNLQYAISEWVPSWDTYT